MSEVFYDALVVQFNRRHLIKLLVERFLARLGFPAYTCELVPRKPAVRVITAQIDF